MLKLSPYSYFNRLSTGKPSTHDHLLFFGRISKYKGVDILLDAMPDILSKHPNEKLIIAGKGADEALLNHPSLKKYSQNITFLNRYIPNEELVELIKGAKMVICPYRDASQSGVLMTSFALNKPVIAADTGAFSEDVKNNENGLLIKNITPKNLSNAIEQALAGETYLAWEKNLDQTNQENPWEQNISILKKAYS